MALWEGNKRKDGTRSHTHLIKSGHMSPAQEWILDPQYKKPALSSVFKDGFLFSYQYGGVGQEEVVIPMGRLVGVAPSVKSFTTGKLANVMTAPALARNHNVIGMVPYNICKDYFETDRFGGNAPSIITLDYVTLPYMPGVTAEAMTEAGFVNEEQKITHDGKMPWGAVIGAGISVGDYLKATPSGRLTKWDAATDNFADVVGQILGEDMNSEPWGWMQWMLWDNTARYEDDVYVNKSGASNLPSDNGYAFDPEYKNGTREDVIQGYQGQFVTNPTGIPGLHDGSGNFLGYGKRDTEMKDINIGAIPSAIADNTMVVLQLVDYAGVKKGNIREGVVIEIDGTPVAADRLTINYTTGQVTVKAMAADADKAVTATFKAEFYGTPSHLDFKGVVGAFHVLLKK